MALGMAKASGRPVAVTCTSGTAAANLAPAVNEASQARVPLIVLTADRPPELREVGAGQAIDQLKLYGAAVRWFAEVGSHEPSRATAVHHRQLGCRAYFTAAGDLPGPVHLNFPLREPLAPEPEDLDAERLGGPRGRAPLDRAPRPLPRPPRRRRAGPGGADGGGAAGCDRVRPDGRRRWRSPSRAWPRRPAGPCWPSPPPASAAATHDRSHVVAGLRRAAPRRGVHVRPRAGPGAARGRHAHLEAPARVAGRARPRCCSTRTPRGTSPPAPPS